MTLSGPFASHRSRFRYGRLFISPSPVPISLIWTFPTLENVMNIQHAKVPPESLELLAIGAAGSWALCVGNCRHTRRFLKLVFRPRPFCHLLLPPPCDPSAFAVPSMWL